MQHRKREVSLISKPTEGSIIRVVIFDRSSRPEVLLGKGVPKIRSKFTEEHPYRSVISAKLLCNFATFS